jgi:UDP-3-O-[3-hydroxymyristoyl] N-acetylglucosamine deacetylase
VRVSPCEKGIGLQFALNGKARFPALVEYAKEAPLATVLVSEDGQKVSTVEHILSALFAMGVDNALIEVEGAEIPLLDGSSAPFCEEIARVGLVEQDAPRATCSITEPLSVEEGDAKVTILPSDAFRVRFDVDFKPPIGRQSFSAVIEPETYASEIAAARTFCYLDDVEKMRAAGLIRGGSLDNAVVFGSDGPMTPLRWPDEAVRHKTLDLIGDFALAGAWPRCEVVAFKSGHRLHARAVAELRRRVS